MSESQYKQAYMKGYVGGKRSALNAYAHECIDEQDVIPLSVIDDIKEEMTEYCDSFIMNGRVDLADVVDTCMEIIDRRISGKE